MNVLQNLIELYNHLSWDSTYRDIVKGILMNLPEASDCSVYELADLTNSSRTTIWRMLKLLGYDNYSVFRNALKAAVGKYDYYNRIIPKKLAFDEKSVAEYVEKEMSASLRGFRADTDNHALEALAEKVSRKKQVFFYFPYRSSSIYSFQQNLAMAGIESCAICLFPEMMESAASCGPDTLVFCKVIEHTETTDMMPLFEALHRNRAETILFGSEESNYADCVDSILCLDDEGGILSSLIRVDLFLFALSESFRRNCL